MQDPCSTGPIQEMKVGSLAVTQENRTQGVQSNKASRLCYKAEPGTFSHYLSSSWSRRQRYQVSIKKSHTQLLRINWNETTVQIDIFARMFANTPEYVNFCLLYTSDAADE